MTEDLLEARGVRVSSAASPHGLELLPATSLQVRPGEVRLVVGDPGPAHVLLALALAGRLDGAEGTVTLAGSADRTALQQAVVLVDVPGVNEPEPGLPVGSVVGEELAMAGQHAGRGAVRDWLGARDLDPGLRCGQLTPAQRIGMMTSLAGLRGPRFAVLTLPERHGGLPEDWVDHLDALAQTGVGLVVTASHGLATHYAGLDAVEIGDTETEPA